MPSLYHIFQPVCCCKYEAAGCNVTITSLVQQQTDNWNPCKPCWTLKDRNNELHFCLNLTYCTSRTSYHITTSLQGQVFQTPELVSMKTQYDFGKTTFTHDIASNLKATFLMSTLRHAEHKQNLNEGVYAKADAPLMNQWPLLNLQVLKCWSRSTNPQIYFRFWTLILEQHCSFRCFLSPKQVVCVSIKVCPCMFCVLLCL